MDSPMPEMTASKDNDIIEFLHSHFKLTEEQITVLDEFAEYIVSATLTEWVYEEEDIIRFSRQLYKPGLLTVYDEMQPCWQERLNHISRVEEAFFDTNEGCLPERMLTIETAFIHPRKDLAEFGYQSFIHTVTP